MVELPRQSHRLLGKPPEYTPSQLEGLCALVSSSSGRIRSIEIGSSSIFVHTNHQIPTTEHIYESISFFEGTGSISPSSELANEPKISEPETEPFVLETYS